MSSPRRTSPTRWSVVAAVAVSTASVLPPFLVGAMSVQLRDDLGFGEAGLGLAVGLSFTVAAVTSALAGRIVERAGAVVSMRVAAGAAAVVLAGLALAPTFGALLAVLAVGGAANSGAQASSNLLLARSVPSRRQATAFGLKQSAIPGAMLLGGLAVPSVALTVGWRWAFAGAAVLAAGAALVVPATSEATRAVDRAHAMPRVTVPLALLALAGGLGAASANTLGTFLVSSSVAAGVSEGSAGLLYALGSAVGLAARVSGGIVADRTGRRDAFPVVATMLTGGALGFALLATGSMALLVPATVVAFGLGWGWPGLFNWAVVMRHPETPAAATGITQTGVYLGALSGPLVFGLLAERASYGTAWTFALGCALAAAVMIGVADRAGIGRPGTEPAEAGAGDPQH